MQNYISFESELETELPIYRIFSIDRLIAIFKTKKLALVRPNLWDDPFENFILNSKVDLGNGDTATLGFANTLYGQCWSRHKETDAMWRIYSHDKNGVKIRTSSKKIREALASKVNNPEISAFIGKVEYKYQKDLVLMLTDRARMSNKIFDSSGRGHAETLLFKRKEFSHEKEVRLIYSCSDNITNDVFTFEIDPFFIIEEIVFDPRMEKRLVEQYTNELKEWGYSGPIKQSTLYTLPKLKVCV